MAEEGEEEYHRRSQPTFLTVHSYKSTRGACSTPSRHTRTLPRHREQGRDICRPSTYTTTCQIHSSTQHCPVPLCPRPLGRKTYSVRLIWRIPATLHLAIRSTKLQLLNIAVVRPSVIARGPARNVLFAGSGFGTQHGAGAGVL